jgi:streptomycin 6-kinase
MLLALDRLRAKAHEWQVTIDESFETSGSLLAFGVSRGSRVVLKIIKQHGDEWRSGEVLQAFDGHGTVRGLEYDAGVVLLERLDPAAPLVDLVRQGKDQAATEILAEVMREMQEIGARAAPAFVPTVLDWARAFASYLDTSDKQISFDLVTKARDWYLTLAASQRTPTLLHGDLQHYNVLFDSKRGWVAIDPKGVVGEIEYEMGAILRNPVELPELFTSTATVEQRLNRLARMLSLDYDRALAWAFAQAVLSAIWDIEDGYTVRPDHPALKLVHAIKPLLHSQL